VGAIERQSFDTLEFFWKRLGRIYPLHFVVLMAYVLLLWVYPDVENFASNGEHYSFKYVPLHLLMIQDWGNLVQLTLNYPAWSLSAEWFAYLLFPASVFAVLYLRVKPWTHLALAGGTIAILSLIAPTVFGQPFNTLTWHHGLLRTFPDFLLGIGVYRLVATSEVGRLTARAMFLAAVVGIFAVGHFALPRFWGVALFGVLIFSVAARARHQDRGILDHPALVYLGDISFSVFMVHAFCFTVVAIGLTELLGAESYRAWQLPIYFGSVALIYVTAALSYRFIEAPGRRLFAQWRPGALRRFSSGAIVSPAGPAESSSRN
jgi:peptidoglycan/LPS O-acetylase OafA/YrhL